MATPLFDIHSTWARNAKYRMRSNNRHYFGTVKAEAGALAGVLAADGHVYRPDMVAVRACLPHAWLKAWDKAGGVWFDDTGKRQHGTITLRDSRGDRIAEISFTMRVHTA